MPSHYIYEEPDRACLNQGDVLHRTNELVQVLQEIHPYYCNDEYKYFMVLTQSCDLYDRNGQGIKSYIEICCVKPIASILEKEASAHQELWQAATKVLSAKSFEKFRLFFVESLLDNNQRDYFYLHEDQSLGIAGQHCAVLALSVSLQPKHYKICADAKAAQLKEPFRAKLGWLVGSLYNRVGTSEWNDHYGKGNVVQKAKEMLDSYFEQISDDKIKETISDIVSSGRQLTDLSPEEIHAEVQKKKLISRKDQFRDRASIAFPDSLLQWILTPLVTSLKTDSELERGINEILTDTTIDDTVKREKLLDHIKARLRYWMHKENMPGYDDVVKKIIGALLNDATIGKILSK